LYPHYPERFERLRGLKKILWQLLPFQTWDELRFELQAIKIRLAQPFRHGSYRKQDNFFLNVGCGGSGVQGWVNLDLFPAPGVNCLWDARRSLPFQNESCEGIFTEHFLEHLEPTVEAPTFMRECHRILKRGGKIRILVPDGEAYLKAYAQGGWEGLKQLRGLCEDGKDPWFGHGYQTRMELINMVFRQGVQHAFTYDFETLALRLTESGFKDVRNAKKCVSINARLRIDNLKRSQESLVVEAAKI